VVAAVVEGRVLDWLGEELVAEPLLLDPVGEPVTEPVWLEPVGEAVTEPVWLEPVAEAVAEPVWLEPVGEPVIEPVAEAVGLELPVTGLEPVDCVWLSELVSVFEDPVVWEG